MVTTKAIEIDGKALLGIHVDLPNAPALMIVGTLGFVGCGYFSIEVADKVGHALAVVSGVRTLADVLDGSVKSVSATAAEHGVTEGMSGRDAARLLA